MTFQCDPVDGRFINREPPKEWIMRRARLSKGVHPLIVLIAGLIVSIGILAVIGSYTSELRAGKGAEVSHGSDAQEDELSACERSRNLERRIFETNIFPEYRPIRRQVALIPDNQGDYWDILENYGSRECNQECQQALPHEGVEEPRVYTPARSRLLLSQWGLQDELEPVLALLEQMHLIEFWDPLKYDMVREAEDNKLLVMLFVFRDTMDRIDLLIDRLGVRGMYTAPLSGGTQSNESREYEAVTAEIDAFDERIEHAWRDVCQTGYGGTYIDVGFELPKGECLGENIALRSQARKIGRDLLILLRDLTQEDANQRCLSERHIVEAEETEQMLEELGRRYDFVTYTYGSVSVSDEGRVYEFELVPETGLLLTCSGRDCREEGIPGYVNIYHLTRFLEHLADGGDAAEYVFPHPRSLSELFPNQPVPREIQRILDGFEDLAGRYDFVSLMDGMIKDNGMAIVSYHGREYAFEVNPDHPWIECLNCISDRQPVLLFLREFEDFVRYVDASGSDADTYEFPYHVPG